MASAELTNVDLFKVVTDGATTVIDIMTADGTAYKDTPEGLKEVESLLAFTLTVPLANVSTAEALTGILNKWKNESAKLTIKFDNDGSLSISNQETGERVSTRD